MKLGLGVLLANYSHATEFKTKISHWNTGQLFSYDVTEYSTPVFGPVCSDSGSSTSQESFGRATCIENGFESVEFIGNQADYIQFVESNKKEIEPTKYFQGLKKKTSSTCGINFRSVGTNCPTTATAVKDCQLGDYSKVGGNCVKGSSSVFIHCQIFKNVGKLEPGHLHRLEMSSCRERDCNVEKQVAYLCANNTVTDGTFITSEETNVVCSGTWLETRRCTECDDADSSVYNDGYYDYDSYSSDSSSFPRGPTPDDPADDLKKVTSTKPTVTDIEPDERPLACEIKFAGYCPAEWPKQVRDAVCSETLPKPLPSPAVAEVAEENSDKVDGQTVPTNLIEAESCTTIMKLFISFLFVLCL